MRVVLRLKETSQPVIFNNVLNTYQKGDMYCVMYIDNTIQRVRKYPLYNIFDTDETYS
jgi:hypothetical protein